ncbi:MAG: CaiB/BaiF CoA-transferase family protein [Burkholderiaceae bacterium]|nr:CaiB/BaiF CoA-transferase family protein [Burkholderiaceae bacterium]
MQSHTKSSLSPLSGIKIVEFEGIGPGPLTGLMLMQMGADVTVVGRPGAGALPDELTPKEGALLSRGKRRVMLNLKRDEDRAQALDLIANSDGLIEGNRPGVMERLGLGPDACGERNPRLVYGRMTGWGQDGPLAHAAGHDMNYVALTGLMSLTERPGHPPMVPPTVIGDAAGALGFAFGMVSALLGARTTGQGCVVDGAIVDVLAMLSPLVQLIRQGGGLEGSEPSVFHDSPFYDRYRCSDGRYITVGAIEPPFYALLLQQLELTDVNPAQQMDKSLWPALKARMAQRFAAQPSEHWNGLMVGTDSCFAPVLTMAEAAAHPHNVARGLYNVTTQGDIETARGLRILPLR